METIEIKEIHKQLFYIPTVKGQNNNQAVKFKLSSSGDNELVFENPEHDFPQKISYKLISDDSLIAEISGDVNGTEKVKRFPMRRLKE